LLLLILGHRVWGDGVAFEDVDDQQRYALVIEAFLEEHEDVPGDHARRGVEDGLVAREVGFQEAFEEKRVIEACHLEPGSARDSGVNRANHKPR
jgi:hypothetical protein